MSITTAMLKTSRLLDVTCDCKGGLKYSIRLRRLRPKCQLTTWSHRVIRSRDISKLREYGYQCWTRCHSTIAVKNNDRYQTEKPDDKRFRRGIKTMKVLQSMTINYDFDDKWLFQTARSADKLLCWWLSTSTTAVSSKQSRKGHFW